MNRLLHRLRHQPLSQQLALSAAGCCLLATLTLVLVASQSTQSIQNTTLTEHAKAAAEQLAARAATELSAGDRLGLEDPKTGESLPAALLNYNGRTLIEGLLRDLTAREWLYYKTFGEHVKTPVAIMTSAAKGTKPPSMNWF